MSTGSKTTMLTHKRFEQLLGIYGADLSRWKPEDASAARALLVESQPARELYKKMEKLGAALDVFSAPPVPSGLSVMAANNILRTDRIARAAKAEKKSFFAGLFAFKPMMAGGAFAAAALLLAVALSPGKIPLVKSVSPQQAQPTVVASATQTPDSGDVNNFLQNMDRQASVSQKELDDADQMFSMLSPDQAGSSSDGTDQQPEQGQP